ncbi:MAG: translation elongation factor Ts [Planctomycetota bacterium]
MNGDSFDEDELRKWFERHFPGSSDRFGGMKDALRRANGDVDAAFDELRKAGLSEERKRGTVHRSGGIATAFAADARAGAIVLLACQTDFVARGDSFRALLAELARLVLEHAPRDVEALGALEHPTSGVTVREAVERLGRETGEELKLAACERFANATGRVGGYVHHDGKKGALVSVTTGADEAQANAFLKLLSMHVVSAWPTPIVVTRDEITPAVIERERGVLLELPDLKGKPAELQEKILKGRMETFFAERVLSEQAWMLDDKLTVQKAVEAALGKGAKIDGFARFQIGK